MGGHATLENGTTAGDNATLIPENITGKVGVKWVDTARVCGVVHQFFFLLSKRTVYVQRRL